MLFQVNGTATQCCVAVVRQTALEDRMLEVRLRRSFIFNSLICSLLLGQGWLSDVFGRSVCMSVCLSVCDSLCSSVSRITHECGNGSRPNTIGIGKEWPARSD